MQFIEALKLRNKLFFLFILITMGLISVGVIGSMHLNSMKKNIDKLYFGSLVPVTELNEIIQIYHNGLANSVYKASRLEISPSQTSLEIQHAIEEIRKKWKSYESHFKRNEELDYLGYTTLEIKHTNEYFLKIYKVAKEGKDLTRIKLSILEKKVSYIHNVIQKLIKYEVDVAHYERKKFIQNYEYTKKQLGTVLFFIILAILLISMHVFKSIQKDHTILELTTKKLKKANKKLENVSYTDSLTSLHNRRYFNLVYEREIKRAKRKNNYITFMMLDVDFFKQYNDTYGHIEGDYALQTVSKVLKNTLQRPSDYVFRLGGEEFGVLLTDTDESNSAKLARDICDAIRDKKLKHENSSVNEFVTISIGVVCCIADDALDEDVLISRADEMLYEAKETGRDRYIITSNVSSAKVRTA
ncbi:diguanylate cyclase (GGDEF domain) with PAS/PAC sensor [hydrothermal vent metagenome]|uniref:Diguanylate cyclase (GGDEF domain) with PAS/PAC sensor n=1 Tax=hydrothermal vent metagenome TaxID=652676 RepID=A0A1W1C500_9ZZZZ